MRASRLVSLLLLLQTSGGATAARLARELEVSVRTIYRDVEALSASGVPIYAEPGPGGGIRLVEGYRTRLTGLTVDEADAIALTGLPGPAAELGLGTVLAAAQLKVMAALPPELRSRASRVRERFLLDVPGWFRRTEEAPHLQAVAEALWADRRIEVDYRRPARVDDEPAAATARTLDPLGIVCKAGTWYLVAASAGEPRTYRVSRIAAVRHLDEPADRPADFDLARHWERSQRQLEERIAHVAVRVRLSAEGAQNLHHAVGSALAERALAEAGAPDADGWVTTVVGTESLDVALYQLRGLGPEVEVLGPRALRATFVAAAAATSALYR